MDKNKDLQNDQVKDSSLTSDFFQEKEIHEKGEGEGFGRWVCAPVETGNVWPCFPLFTSLCEALVYAENEWEGFKRGEATDLFDDLPPCSCRASYLVGRIEPFVPKVDGSWVIDCLQEQAYQVGEAAEGWMDYVGSEEVDKLTKALTAAFNDWAREYHQTPSFSSIEDIREMLVGDCS